MKRDSQKFKSINSFGITLFFLDRLKLNPFKKLTNEKR